MSEHTFTKFGYLTGTGFKAKSTSHGIVHIIVPQGMAYYQRHDNTDRSCPEWRRDCSATCWGSANVDGLTDEQIIHLTIDKVYPRSTCVIMKESFYNSNKDFVDSWRRENPEKPIFIGYPTNTGKGCSSLIYKDMPDLFPHLNTSNPIGELREHEIKVSPSLDKMGLAFILLFIAAYIASKIK